MNTDIEIWKPIQGYENLYEISSKGRVKSLNYRQTGKEHFLKQYDNHGYLNVYLYKNNKRKQFLVHRLVAQAFLPNPKNNPIINHKDENKQNNFIENLEWCTVKYNNNYGTVKERSSKKQLNDPNKSKPIKCINLETNEITIYPSIHEVARQFQDYRINIQRHIYKYQKPYKNQYIFEEAN